MENLIKNETMQHGDRLDIARIRQLTQEGLKNYSIQVIEDIGDSLINAASAGFYDVMTRSMTEDMKKHVRAYFKDRGYSVEDDSETDALIISWGP